MNIADWIIRMLWCIPHTLCVQIQRQIQPCVNNMGNMIFSCLHKSSWKKHTCMQTVCSSKLLPQPENIFTRGFICDISQLWFLLQILQIQRQIEAVWIIRVTWCFPVYFALCGDCAVAGSAQSGQRKIYGYHLHL